MIKKILSAILIFCFTVLSSQAAFVKNIDGLRVSKEEIKLESFLNKKYRLYKYTLQNEGDNEFSLYLGSFDSKSIFKNARDVYRRDKFPYSYGHIARATGETVGAGALFVTEILFLPLCLFGSPFDYYAFENIPLGADIPKTYIINPVKSTLLLPYDLRKNPKEYEKAKNELKEIKPLFEENWKQIVIKPKETFEFYDLLPIEGISGKSEKWFELRIKTKEGNTYMENFMY